MNRNSVAKAVKNVIKSFDSKVKPDEIGPRVYDIYNDYFKAVREAGHVAELEEKALSDMMLSFQDVAADIIHRSEVIPKSEDYTNLHAYLRHQPIRISEELKSDVHFGEFRKKHMGTLNLTNDGTPVDMVYQELCEVFPHLFGKSISNPADQLIKIAETVDQLRPQPYNPYEVYGDEAINFVVEQLVSEAEDLTLEAPSKADKLMEKALKEKEEALAAQRRQFEKKYHRLKEEAQRYYEKVSEKTDTALQKLRDQQRAAAYKASIRKTANEFTKALQGRRDGVPKELVKAVADVCSKLDFHTDRTGENGEPTKVSLKLDELKIVYDKLKNDPDYDFSSEFDEAVSNQIGQLNDIVKGKRIVDLTVNELTDLDVILKEIKHTVSEANKQIGIDEAVENRELGETIIREFQAQPDIDNNAYRKAVSGLSSQVFNPMRIIRVICGFDDNAQLYKSFSKLNEGVHKMDKFIMDATKPFEHLMAGRGNASLYHDFLTKPIDTGMKYVDGSEVMLPKSMICELLMLWERKQARDHIGLGGLTIPEFKEFNKGNITKAFTEGKKLVRHVTETDIARMHGMLDEYDKLWIEEAHEFFNGIAQRAINETSMILKGRKIATAGNYIPIHTDKNFVRKEIEGLKVDATIEGNGSLKSVIPNASQPLYLMGLPHTVNEHVGFVGRYSGLAIPIRNFNKVYNVSLTKVEDESISSVQKIIGDKWGIGIKEGVIEQTIRDLQSSRKSDNGPISKAFGTLQSNWVAATLNFNVSVSMKQAASYPTAAYVLGMKPLIKALKTKRPMQEVLDEIDRYTGIHYKRRMGLSTQELGDLATSKNLVKKVNDRIGNVLTDRLHLPSGALPSNWIQTVDVMTTAKLWEASRIYVEDELSITNDDVRYWNEVAKIYEKTIEETQPNYDVLHRPEVQKSTNQLVRAIIMFQTQPLQNSGILYGSLLHLKEAGQEYKKHQTESNKAKVDAAKREFGRGIVALLTSALTFSAMSILARFIMHKLDDYRDEKGNVSAIKTLMALSFGAMSNMFTNAVPAVGNDVLEITNKLFGKGYDVEAPVIEMVNDLVDASANVVKTVNKVTGVESYADFGTKAAAITKSLNVLIKQASAMFGVPLSNAENLFGGIRGYINDAKHGELFYDGKEEYRPTYVYNYADLAGAIMSGNVKKEAKIRKYFNECGREINKGTITKYVKPAYRKYYVDDPVRAAQIKKKLVEHYGYKEKTIDAWVEEG